MKDKRILILGASSGIGAETAQYLSREGCQVILAARREEMLKAVLEKLDGDGHKYYTTDVTDPDSLDNLFKAIKQEDGPLDGMVYCAGVNSTMPLTQLKPDKVHAVFEVNFFGFIEAMRQFARRGRYNEGARVVAVSSMAAIRGDKAHTAYSASKAAMNAAVRCLAKELADKKIYVNAVEPAMTQTEMLVSYAEEGGGVNSGHEELLKRQYLGLIQPEEVAKVISFLLGSGASAMTGLAIPVDGGLSTN